MLLKMRVSAFCFTNDEKKERQMSKEHSTNPLSTLNSFEWGLWLFSLGIVTISFLAMPEKDYLTLAASLIGVTALIFVSKGHVLGQILTVIFAVFYGIVSFIFNYYGEMITYLGMTAPMAILAIISWIRHPHKKTKSVAVSKVTIRQLVIMIIISIGVTIGFYFILKKLNTPNLIFSTISVFTSFVAVYLTFLRSPFYALAYSANDIVLIFLWILASQQNKAYVPMIICFLMFLVNDIYGFINWRRIEKIQRRR